MKKAVKIILVLSIIFSLSSCGALKPSGGVK